MLNHQKSYKCLNYVESGDKLKSYKSSGVFVEYG